MKYSIQRQDGWFYSGVNAIFKPQFSPVQLIVFDTPEEINQILEDLAKAGHEDLHIVSLIIG